MKGQKKIVGFVFILLAVSLFIYAINQSNVFSVTGTSQYIESPVFGWVECLPTGQTKTTAFTDVTTIAKYKASGTDGKTTFYGISCNDFGETNGCSISLQKPADVDVPFSVDRYGVYYSICSGSQFCGNTKTLFEGFGNAQTYENIRVEQNQVMFVSYQRLGILAVRDATDASGLKALSTFEPYVLYKTDIIHGGKTQINAENCAIPTTVKDKLIQSSTISQLTGLAPTNINKVIKGEPVNYVSTYVPLAAANAEFQTYNGENVQCRNNGLYSIEKVTFNNYEYYVASSDYQKKLTSVECCNNDYKPGFVCENNKWISQTSQSSCDAFTPCQPSTWTADTTKLGTYVIGQCVEKKCQYVEKKASCTLDYGCQQNQICSVDSNNPSNNKCVNLAVGTSPPPTPLVGEKNINYTNILLALIALSLTTLSVAFVNKAFVQKTVKADLIRYSISLILFITLFVLILNVLMGIVNFFVAYKTVIFWVVVIAAILAGYIAVKRFAK